MNTIRTIFLDLDDVCNVCTPCMIEHVTGLSYVPYPECGYDILNASHTIAKAAGYPNLVWTRKEFWSLVSQHTWANAPVSEEYEWLLNRCCELVGRKNVFLLTSAIAGVYAESPDCVAGKFEWIQKHWPSDMQEQVIITSQKHLLARHDTLLIDDSDKNVTSFCGYGGNAILVPRPWNSLHGINGSKDHVMHELSAFFHGQANVF
jgi:hypothetical protein